jgi:energy coupling factor transporter S component ThiW
MKKTNTRKLALAGVFCAVAVVGSLLSFPVLGSKCSPVQHMVNILCAVLLGPGYGLGAAFAAALIRNLLGLGSLMAFPGSMFGALVCGLVYAKTKNILGTLIGEVAYGRLAEQDGSATYRNYIIDAIYNLTPERLEEGAKYEVR